MPRPTNCPTRSTQRLGEIEAALEAFDERPVIYDPAEIARAGVFVSIDADGALRVERGYVRPEDEAAGRTRARCGRRSRPQALSRQVPSHVR